MSSLHAQQPTVVTSSPVVPRLVNFSGKATDAQGKVISGIAGVTLAIYKDQSEGAPLWTETQSVQADVKGNYTVQLGSTKPDGLPLDLFSSGEARWLGVTVNGGQEQPRVLLLSVPYALKAADAETIGGLPPSAFVLANQNQGSGANSQSASNPAAAKTNAPPPANPAVTGKGVATFIPMWDSTSDIINSIMSQKTSQIGIATTTPAATLDVNGKSDIRDTLTLFPNTTDPSLVVNGTAFKVDQKGKVTFVGGQNFPGVAKLNAVNTFTGNQGVIGTVTVSGSLGVGTGAPQASLDVFSNTAGDHAPIGKFGSSGANDCNSIRTYTGTGTTEIFQAGAAGCFVPEAVQGDGGLRVLPGNRILLGDSGANRVLIDSVGNVEQQRTAAGFVKAMLHFSPFNGGRIISCFNSTLSGAAATTPPCGFLFDITGVGDYIFDFGFEVDDRIYSVTPSSETFGGGQKALTLVDACGNQDGQCLHTGTLTNNQVEVAVVNSTTDVFLDSKIHLIVY